MRSVLTSVVLAAALGLWAVGVGGLLGGCAAPGPTELSIAPGRYAAAFDAAREVLRDARFDIDRVDARAGVITTTRRVATGVALPWDMAGTSADQQVEDFMNRQSKRIRVSFEPAAAATEPKEPAPIRDLLGAEPGELVMRVRVLVEREQRPTWRLESTSVRLSTRSGDPALARRAMEPGYAVVLREDVELGGRLAARIARRLEEAAGAER